MADPRDNTDPTVEEIILTNAPKRAGGDGPRLLEIESDDFIKPIKVKIGDYVNKKTKECCYYYYRIKCFCMRKLFT